MVAAQRDAMTVRIPSELLAQAKEQKRDGESLNDLIVTALANETKYRRGIQALESITRIREAVKARTGLHPDATQLIHELREGIGRRD